MQFVILPSDQKDVGSQRCFLGRELMTRLSLKLKGVVFVKVGNKCYICICWPRHDKFENYITVNRLVELEHHEETELSSNFTVATVQPVQCFTAVELIVDVVMQADQSSKYTSQLQLILNDLCICKGSVVNASTTPLGKLFGVRDIYVRFCRTAEDECDSFVCKVTRDSKITVNRVMSAEWFDLRPQNVKRFGGLARVCDELQELASLIFPKSKSILKADSLCVLVSKCVLLKGPAGCGKSLVVASVARSCDAALLVRSASEMFGSRMGEGEEKIGDIFAAARRLAVQGPCILHIRDVDVVCGGKTGRQLVARLAQVLDDVTSCARAHEHLLVVASTNRPTLVSNCLRRGGRFDKEVNV